MQRKKVLQIMKDWANKHCIHPYIEKEYHSGKETGNKVCTVCGQTIYHYREEKPLHDKLSLRKKF